MSDSKLSNGQKRRIDRILGHGKSIEKSLAKLDEGSVTHLVRRGAISSVPDGFPSNSRPEASRSTSETSPTEGALFARDAYREDETSKTLKQVERYLSYVDTVMRSISYSIDRLFQVEDDKRGYEATTSPCAICAELPAEKSAWCLPCWDEWESHGRPDRMRWSYYKLKTENSEGIRLVPTPPKGVADNQRTLNEMRADIGQPPVEGLDHVFAVTTDGIEIVS